MIGVEAVVRRVEQTGDQALQLAQALVRVNTVNRHNGDVRPGNEANGQRRLELLLRELGAGTPGEAHSAMESTETRRIVACAQALAAFLYGRLRA
jgi:acetylornithine deacetylase/succinyl-diaminopimelate desuccinylase-like protein